jgi:hypothetical protein
MANERSSIIFYIKMTNMAGTRGSAPSWDGSSYGADLRRESDSGGEIKAFSKSGI